MARKMTRNTLWDEDLHHNEPETEVEHHCERCGSPDVIEVGDRYLCADCYPLYGSCCLEFGADDLWPKEEG